MICILASLGIMSLLFFAQMSLLGPNGFIIGAPILITVGTKHLKKNAQIEK